MTSTETKRYWPNMIESIKAKQAELSQMIAQLTQEATSTGRHIEIGDCTIELRPGEHYAGTVLDVNGEHLYHLILMAERPTGKLNWQAAMDWAASIGESLPNRQEQALLYATCKEHLKPEGHWSSETNADDASSAWFCYFGNGGQTIIRKSYEGGVVAVRLIPLTT